MKALALSLVFVVLLAACAQAQPAEVKPPEIRYGEDVCDACGMIISEARYAAACVAKDSQEYKFDDAAEMLKFYRDKQADLAQCFVHDFDSEDWLNVENAYYVMAEGIRTPMGYGIITFASKDRAAAMAQEEQGQSYTFSEILTIDLAAKGM